MACSLIGTTMDITGGGGNEKSTMSITARPGLGEHVGSAHLEGHAHWTPPEARGRCCPGRCIDGSAARERCRPGAWHTSAGGEVERASAAQAWAWQEMTRCPPTHLVLFRQHTVQLLHGDCLGLLGQLQREEETNNEQREGRRGPQEGRHPQRRTQARWAHCSRSHVAHT